MIHKYSGVTFYFLVGCVLYISFNMQNLGYAPKYYGNEGWVFVKSVVEDEFLFLK